MIQVRRGPDHGRIQVVSLGQLQHRPGPLPPQLRLSRQDRRKELQHPVQILLGHDEPIDALNIVGAAPWLKKAGVVRKGKRGRVPKVVGVNLDEAAVIHIVEEGQLILAVKVKDTYGLSVGQVVNILLKGLLPSRAQIDIIARKSPHVGHAIMLPIARPEHQTQILLIGRLKLRLQITMIICVKEDDGHGCTGRGAAGHFNFLGNGGRGT